MVFPDDELGLPAAATIRRVMEQGCKQLQGYHYQIVLRELQTLSGHPDRHGGPRVDAGGDRDGGQVRMRIQRRMGKGSRFLIGDNDRTHSQKQLH